MKDKWKGKLTPEQYRVMQEKGTEQPFSGKYWNSHEKGMYKCASCGAELFSADTKFDSNTGWPSFTEPANLENIELKEDLSAGMQRTEVRCKQCGSHLGHVFDDLPRGKAGLPRHLRSKAGGPPAGGGKRYCINSVCLTLEKKDASS